MDNEYGRLEQYRIYNVHTGEFTYSGRTPSMMEGFFHFTAALSTLNKIPYQQCVGMVDINGVEIYEGDILHHKTHGLLGVVSFYEGSFIAGRSTNDRSLIMFNVPKYIEVIGNNTEETKTKQKRNKNQSSLTTFEESEE